ncbi:MAG: GGDEF domain-containing protein [Pseudomonadota bacterium]
MPKPARDAYLTIFSADNRTRLDQIGELVGHHANALASEFYRVLMENDEARPFLSHELVDTRLNQSLSAWLSDLFRARGEEEFESFVNRQRRIGEVHARINVSMHLVQQGLQVLKEGIFTRLAELEIDRRELIKRILLTSDVLDHTVNLFNEHYVKEVVATESQVQFMRMQMTTQNLAMDVESLRGRLLDWLRRTLTGLYQSWISNAELPTESPETNDFALWIQHKGQLMFSGHPDINALLEDKARLADAYERARTACADKDQATFDSALNDLNDTVTKANWHLTELVRHTMELQNLRDPLTGILSRRYMPYILRQQVAYNRDSDKPFTVLMIDIDHFKSVNDEYGHAAGDTVLAQFSATLQSIVRASDFVFRYGGEEFLIVLINTDAPRACAIAEKIRQQIERHPFLLESGAMLKLTASIGMAQHDGHPDFEEVVKRADRALYEAKQAGRNRCMPCAIG